MTLIDLNLNPSDRQLRQFGAVCFPALPLIAWIWGANPSTIAVCGGAGLATAFLAFVVPAVIKPLFLGLTIVATPIGIVVGEIMLFLVYLLVFFPIGTIFRILGRDALQLKIDRNRDSYWQKKHPPKDIASYFRQS